MADMVRDLEAAIRERLGNAPESFERDVWLRFSTNGKVGDTAGYCKVFADGLGAVWGCHRAGISETWFANDRNTMSVAERAELARQVMRATIEREARQRGQRADNARRNAESWSQCVPLVPGDPATRHFKRRGLGSIWPFPECLRVHGSLPYWHEGEKLGAWPAMVAPVVSPDGRVIALHRTWLTPDGRKADVPQVRKLTPAAGRWLAPAFLCTSQRAA